MKKVLKPQPMLFPMPAVLVGTYCDDGNPDAMTAAWAAACCHKPFCLGVAIRQNRLTYANLKAKGAFTINVPSTSQAEAVDYLGIVSGRDRPDKIAVAGMEVDKGEVVDAPIISSCPVNVECELIGELEIGSHTWFVGEVKHIRADEELVEHDGTLNISDLDPLVYATSVAQYWSLGKPVGKAFNMGKKIG
jgi:flavin reductase (DIM6/NTAB) family NADH-FMN oxidoreductase RutF